MHFTKQTNLIKKARRHIKKREYDSAIACLENAGDALHYSAENLIMMATCIQLSDGDRYSLIDAEAMLVRAYEISPANSRVAMELGFFYSAVRSDHSKAIQFFKRARLLSRKTLADTVVGLADEIDIPANELDAFLEKEAQQFRLQVRRALSR